MITGCILCEDPNAELTQEHIFPLNAGGGLHARILCKDCNSILGTYVDGPYLNQKHIELARMAYKIKGRARAIPQPLSGVHEVQGSRGPMRIRLNTEGKAIVVGSSPILRPVEEGLELIVHVDATERENLDHPSVRCYSCCRSSRYPGHYRYWCSMKRCRIWISRQRNTSPGPSISSRGR